MARKVPVERLADNIEKILADFGEEVQGNLDAVTERLAKEGAKTLRAESAGKFRGSGKYGKGWTVQIEKERLATIATIYNKTPGLPHLLENGHANRGGGRTPGRTHISPVEEKLVQAMLEAVNDIS